MISLEPLTNHLTLVLEPDPEMSRVIAVQRAHEGLARFGRVQAVGPEVRDVKAGQRVLASITAGVELAGGVVMIGEDAVLGIEHQ